MTQEVNKTVKLNGKYLTACCLDEEETGAVVWLTLNALILQQQRASQLLCPLSKLHH